MKPQIEIVARVEDVAAVGAGTGEVLGMARRTLAKAKVIQTEADGLRGDKGVKIIKIKAEMLSTIGQKMVSIIVIRETTIIPRKILQIFQETTTIRKLAVIEIRPAIAIAAVKDLKIQTIIKMQRTITITTELTQKILITLNRNLNPNTKKPQNPDHQESKSVKNQTSTWTA